MNRFALQLRCRSVAGIVVYRLLLLVETELQQCSTALLCFYFYTFSWFYPVAVHPVDRLHRLTGLFFFLAEVAVDRNFNLVEEEPVILLIFREWSTRTSLLMRSLFYPMDYHRKPSSSA